MIARRRCTKPARAVALCHSPCPSGPRCAIRRLIAPRVPGTDLLDWIEGKGHQLTILGHAPDGAPVVSVKAGGDKEPAIFISAGSHSWEQAGVGAAVALIDELQTDHQVTFIPNRDPMGINGYGYVLSLSLGEEPSLPSLDDLGAFLKDRGELLYEKGDVVLVLIGEYGYSTVGLYGQFEASESFFEPLKGHISGNDLFFEWMNRSYIYKGQCR